MKMSRVFMFLEELQKKHSVCLCSGVKVQLHMQPTSAAAMTPRPSLILNPQMQTEAKRPTDIADTVCCYMSPAVSYRCYFFFILYFFYSLFQIYTTSQYINICILAFTCTNTNIYVCVCMYTCTHVLKQTKNIQTESK